MKRNVKRLLAMVLGAAMLFTTACGSAAGEETKEAAAEPGVEELAGTGIKVGFVVAGLGTQAFSDDVNTGLLNAKEELGIEPLVLEIANITEVENSLNTLISQGCSILVVAVEEHKDAMLNVAAANPDVTFIYLAQVLDGYDNIISMDYRDNESAFLGGALAAAMTKSEKVGVVLAMAAQSQTRYLYGFTAGARAVNPEVEVQSAYTNSFADVNVGLETANIMYQKGCDIVASYAGACNLGVFSAGEAAGEGCYCIGAATGQFDKSPEKIIASVVKPVDRSLVSILEGYFEGTIKGGDQLFLGLKENGVGLKWTTNEELFNQIPKETVELIEDIKSKVIDGTITVPGSEEELEKFDYTY